MNIKIKSYILSSLVAACALHMYSTEAKAGLIRITNASSNSIRTHIIREPATQCLPYCWKCFDGSIKAGGKKSADLIVPSDAFNGYEYFAVTGTEGGIFGNGECRNLSVLKNYELSFYETTFGVGCVSKEI
ncbi:MAG: hypothetical protein K2P93_00810 [Alphaproteobacteria bacterium]|nr:hypothetical protein [Alphaproteobacteria bacterium]